MIKEEYKHSAITEKIIGLSFVREMVMKIYYDNIDIGTRRVDFFVEEKIMLELKAVSELAKSHLAQGLNYLEAYKMEIGLLINFGETKLKFKRLTIQKKLDRLI